jgi:hypothetical protein
VPPRRWRETGCRGERRVARHRLVRAAARHRRVAAGFAVASRGHAHLALRAGARNARQVVLPPLPARRGHPGGRLLRALTHACGRRPRGSSRSPWCALRRTRVSRGATPRNASRAARSPAPPIFVWPRPRAARRPGRADRRAGQRRRRPWLTPERRGGAAADAGMRGGHWCPPGRCAGAAGVPLGQAGSDIQRAGPAGSVEARRGTRVIPRGDTSVTRRRASDGA